MSTYQRAANNDLAKAFALYEWNMTVSAAVMTTTAMAEVVLRNALDAELRSWAHGRNRGSWLDVAPLDNTGKEDIRQARARATRGGRAEVHGKVVAELTFGFWRYLLKSSYRNTLWRPALYMAFPGAVLDVETRRRDVERHVERLCFVRNRAAHHEPLLTRDLTRDFESAETLTGWICTDSAAWLAARSTLLTVVAQRP